MEKGGGEMSGPWEKYSETAAPKPWEQYAQTEHSATEGVSPSQQESGFATNRIGDPLANYNVDLGTGAPFRTRAEASIKMTPQGQVNYLKSIYGDNNVAVRSDGKLFYRVPGKGQINDIGQSKWIQFDERGTALPDIADLTGGVLESAPAVATGFFTRNPKAVAAAAGGGNILRQGVSAALPGSDEMGAGERVIRPVVSAVLGGATQKGANWLMDKAASATPKSIIAKQAQKALHSPEARRGAQLTQRTGIHLTPGQQTGSRTMLMLEGLARRSPVSADRVANEVDRKQIHQALSYFSKTMDSIDNSAPGAIETGKRVEAAFRGATNKALAARTAQWEADMAGVSKVAGNAPIVQTTNTQRVLQELIEENDVPGAGDATAALVNRLKALTPKTTPKTATTGGGLILDTAGKPLTQATSEAIPAQLTANELKRLLQVYGKTAGGSGQLFKDIDAGQQRYIAGKVFGALKADLDSTIQQGGPNTAILSSLKAARDNWAKNSGAIDSMGETVLGRIFNGQYPQAPEAVANKFMTMHPSEIRTAMGVIGQQDPAAAQAVKRHMIEQALEASRPSGSAPQIAVNPILGGAGTKISGNELSPAKFNSFLMKNADRYRAVLSPKEYTEMKWAYEALGRIADRGGTEGSPTHVLGKLSEWATAAFSAQPKAVANVTFQTKALTKITNIMATPEGRQALITVSRASPKTKAYAGAAATLTALLGRDEAELRATAPQLGQQNPQSARERLQQ